MHPVAPNLPLSGWTEKTYAKTQPEYQPLQVQQSPFHERHTLSRWRLTWLERLALLCGQDLFLMQMVFSDRQGRPNPLQPVLLTVGAPDWCVVAPEVEDYKESGPTPIVPQDTTLA